MSIIIGFISKKNALIASDGRRFSGAKFYKDEIDEKATIIDDDFNKTFLANRGNIIGAFAGITTFQGKNISEHLEKIINDLDVFDLVHQIDNLVNAFGERLENIHASEISFKYRKVDLILITKDQSGFIMYEIRFYPNSNNEKIDHEFKKFISPVDPQLVNWTMFGDISAQKGAIRYIDIILRKIQRRDKDFLNQTIRKAIAQGIKNAEIHELGDDPTCGGQIFSIKY